MTSFLSAHDFTRGKFTTTYLTPIGPIASIIPLPSSPHTTSTIPSTRITLHPTSRPTFIPSSNQQFPRNAKYFLTKGPTTVAPYVILDPLQTEVSLSVCQAKSDREHDSYKRGKNADFTRGIKYSYLNSTYTKKTQTIPQSCL